MNGGVLSSRRDAAAVLLRAAGLAGFLAGNSRNLVVKQAGPSPWEGQLFWQRRGHRHCDLLCSGAVAAGTAPTQRKQQLKAS